MTDRQLPDEICPDEGCPHYGTPHSHPPDLSERVAQSVSAHLWNNLGHNRKLSRPLGLFGIKPFYLLVEAAIRAVAPMLIEHGRELEKAEVVAWLEQRERDSMNGHVVAGCRIGIKNGEHKQESQ